MLIYIAEVICAIVVPFTLLCGTWLFAAIMVFVSMLGTKFICAIFEIWIIVANSVVTVFRFTILAGIYSYFTWIPAAFSRWIVLAPGSRTVFRPFHV